ncbi:MAG TPA: hypothetical protein VMF31_01460 [Solirubrobacterales bacterium]|nr:hypothetical protein [Solirubrobacterales bacterium]
MSKDRTKDILKEIKSLRKELTGRLDALEARLGPGRPGTSPLTHSAPAAPSLPERGNDPVRSFQHPTDRDVSVIIQPLHDLSLARVVEQALAETEGVEKSTLRELRGDSAVIDTRVDEGVSLITSLRRKLPVAFDVTDSDKGSFTIALAQPLGDRADGVAGHEIT